MLERVSRRSLLASVSTGPRERRALARFARSRASDATPPPRGSDLASYGLTSSTSSGSLSIGSPQGCSVGALIDPVSPLVAVSDAAGQGPTGSAGDVPTDPTEAEVLVDVTEPASPTPHRNRGFASQRRSRPISSAPSCPRPGPSSHLVAAPTPSARSPVRCGAGGATNRAVCAARGRVDQDAPVTTRSRSTAITTIAAALRRTPVGARRRRRDQGRPHSVPALRPVATGTRSQKTPGPPNTPHGSTTRSTCSRRRTRIGHEGCEYNRMLSHPTRVSPLPGPGFIARHVTHPQHLSAATTATQVKLDRPQPTTAASTERHVGAPDCRSGRGPPSDH